MKRTLAICSSIILTLYLGGCSGGAKPSNAEINSKTEITEDTYIKTNSSPLELNNLSQASIPILDSAVDNAEVILAGEQHGVSINTKLRMSFIKHFNFKDNIKYYLAEIPYSSAVLVNQYLKTGNEEIITRLVASTKGTFAYSEDEFDFYKELYLYNKSLSEGGKITFVGIDVEHQYANSIWCLNFLLTDKSIPVVIQPVIAELKKLNSEKKYSTDQMVKISAELKESISKNQELYKSFLGENFFDFEFINQNIINKIEGGTHEERENRIFNNFKKTYSHLPKGKYFGQFGFNHILQGKVADADWDWLGRKLNYEDSPVKGKVLSIAYLYDKSSQRLSDNTVKSSSNYLKNDLIDLVAKTDLTLIRLNGQGSPFQKKLIWAVSDVYANNGVTSDYYQYYLLIRNAEAVTRYSESN